MPADQDNNRAAFARLLRDLLDDHAGKYALIHGGELTGVFDTLDAAYMSALERFGLDPFYVGKIQAHPPTEHLPALQLGVIRAYH